MIATRLGLDAAPVDVHDAESVRWLRACLWPHDLERARRFEQAVAIARASSWSVQRAIDDVVSNRGVARGAARGRAAGRVPQLGALYFTPEERERFARSMEGLVRSYGAVWLSAESETFRYGTLDAHLRRPDGDATSWTSCSRGPESSDSVEYLELARSACVRQVGRVARGLDGQRGAARRIVSASVAGPDCMSTILSASP